MVESKKGLNVSRRSFIKTSTLVGIASSLPVTALAASDTLSSAGKSTIVIGGTKPSPKGKKRNLLFVSGVPENYENLIGSIKSIKEYEIHVTPIKTDFKEPKDVLKAIKDKNADILFMSLPGVGMSPRRIAEEMGALDIPIILLPMSQDLIMWETDLAASFRIKGTNALVANSDDHAIELVKVFAAPRILEGKKALVFGRPFNSTSVPSPNLDADYVYQRMGVKIEHRPIDELRERIKTVDEAAARKEMERWKAGATKIDGPTEEAILEAAKLSVLLRSIVDQEGLSGISIDCLSFTFGQDKSLPVPCLAITRMRDDGVAAPCEADISMMLSTMIMQEISKRPSFVCNVSSVDMKKSTTVLRHCVAPTKIYGKDAPAVPYVLKDYHGMGSVTSEIEYPIGLDITMGGFSKDLGNFVIWPGRIQPTIEDRATPSFADAPPEMQKMRRYCTNKAEIKINGVKQFLQCITGIHHIMVAGSYGNAINDAMLRMNVNIIAPNDLTVPEV